MKRVIITPPDLSGAPLQELKSWLAISTPQHDAALLPLLHAACEMCEAFTGQLPVQTELEETLAPLARWQRLASAPVTAITTLDSIAADGSREAAAADGYEIDIDGGASGYVRVLRSIDATRIAVRFTAGIASDWGLLPDGIRHGILRLAASLYRRRDESESGAMPPAAVAALWRPWRQLRIA